MNLSNNIENDKNETLTKEGVENFIKEIEERLIRMENEIKSYTIDRFEENIAVCEDRDTKEMINIDISELPEGSKEGTILSYKDGKFYKAEEEQQEIEERIKRKMDDLWN